MVEADLNPVRCMTSGCVVLDMRLRVERPAPGGARQDLVTSRGRDQRGQARRVERPGRLYLEPVTHLRPPLEESRPEHGVAQEPSLPLDPAFLHQLSTDPDQRMRPPGGQSAELTEETRAELAGLYGCWLARWGVSFRGQLGASVWTRPDRPDQKAPRPILPEW